MYGTNMHSRWRSPATPPHNYMAARIGTGRKDLIWMPCVCAAERTSRAQLCEQGASSGLDASIWPYILYEAIRRKMRVAAHTKSGKVFVCDEERWLRLNASSISLSIQRLMYDVALNVCAIECVIYTAGLALYLMAIWLYMRLAGNGKKIRPFALTLVRTMCVRVLCVEKISTSIWS